MPHDVVSVRRREWLDGIDSFRNLVQNVLNEGELQDVARRVNEACTRNDETDE
jgi:hypothetical protein